MNFKDKVVKTRKAIASTASHTASKTKTAINNAQLGEKTKNAMANIKEKTVDAKKAVVEKSKDLKQAASQKYQNFKEKDEDIEVSAPTSARKLSVSSPVSPLCISPRPDGATDLSATKIFGVPLDVACRHSVVQYYHSLPDIVFKCIAYLFEKATNEEGIFRLSGSSSMIQKMKSSFDEGVNVDFEECYDQHVISGLLKLFLRELPTPIAPRNVCSGPEKLNDLSRKIRDLPPVDRCILANLMRLLQVISQNESKTKMTTSNLVIIFVPTLSCSSDIVHLMIAHASELFACEPIIPFSTLLRSHSSSEGYSSVDETELDNSFD